ncbi:beta-glucoside-specific PTS transporter subunit IIABC [Mammaliicoccus sciuri]|uniref:beta-glucoside-specific PTS transporter subunit IIABC n=1 Tax=Mammaliicoccus sciuri TaxID=1296 RepID=UPI0021CED20C|nr:beta-glucoside-specific PTS transporter subunit IIABC [Mammaliicoccus sciuri]UXU83920.1 beta-glucoside-specific PTS transporter subunit IIABC [Mammaliicoccus sciuri]UXU93767.1 beta-glucoside-specific PTS transporter subunit IIABC [Mammaliicoccus sciuri]UXV15715.1 beta-glucoside-specific PTS transporter subunit IIABC [Mammaliicoccus sciuri]UXV23977.1 beta-glucoside-specific PTS transporter subunit IIABC [Mammaliicoccus sciuri]UXV26758.1 beta-glucoside-specific PTS transporter subunit IIABC [
MNYDKLGTELLDLVGGEDNVQSLEHCATRLRFRLKNNSEANKEKIEALPKVLQVVEQGGQFQIVIGNEVSNVYEAIINKFNIGNNASSKQTSNEKQTPVNIIFGYISGTFSPLLPALAGSGMLKALLEVLKILGWIDEKSATFAVLSAASNAIFYFLPIFIGISASKKLKANAFMGGVIAAALMEPTFTALLKAKESLTFIGLPLIVTDFASTVFPLLIAVAIYAPLERLLKKLTPKVLQLFLVPMISLLIMVPLTVLIFGPFSEYVSTGIGNGIEFMLGFSRILTGIIIASIWPLLVVLGVHWGVVPIMIDNYAHGGDIINPITAASVFAQIGISFGVVLRTRKNKDLRSLSIGTTLSGLLAGVTEPILYGLILRYKRLIPIVLVAGGIGGAIIAIFDARVSTFVLNNLFTIPVYKPMIGYAIGIGVSFIIAAILTFIFGYESRSKVVNPNDNQNKDINKHTETNTQFNAKEITLWAPLVGEIKPLSQVPDPVFSAEAMGKGVAIEPHNNEVYAPFDGYIETIFNTKHAIGIKSNQGLEVLIHIGLDTVELKGEYFKTFVEAGQHVKKGELLIRFNEEEIKQLGYKLVTPIVITNSDRIESIQFKEETKINQDEKLMTVTLKN